MRNNSGFVKSIAIAAFSVLAFSSSSQESVIAQGIALGQSDLIRQLRDTGAAMKEYAKTHDHFPNTESEYDDCLRMLFKKVSLTAADTTVVPKSVGRFRCYYQFAIGVDPSFKSVPIVNGVPQIPDNYNAPASTVVIMTDGNDDCVGWVAGNDGRPVVMEGGPIFFDAQIKPKDASSSSVSGDQ